MKLVFFNSLYDPNIGGGAEVTIKTLAEGLVRRGHDVTVISLVEHGHYSDSIDPSGVRRVYEPHFNIYWHYKLQGKGTVEKLIWHLRDSWNKAAQSSFDKWVEELKPDAISIHNLAGWSAAVWDSLKNNNKLNAVQVLHDLYPLCTKSTMFDGGLHSCRQQCIACKVVRMPARISSNSVKKVVGISEYILRQHLDLGYFDKAKIKTVLHNKRYFSTLDFNPDRRPEYVNGPLRVGFLGTLKEHKGALWLAQAVKTRPDLDISLVFAGKGETPYLELLKSEFDGRMSYVGYVQAEEFLSSIDVLVVPSLWNEPLGMVVAEASIVGCVSLVSDRGGLPELVRNGHNGFIFKEAGDLLDRLDFFARDRVALKEFSKNSLLMRDHFQDVAGWVSQYEDIYCM